ncbi:hypothetical protein D3W54_14775 [Komagataeibacter medellinensis]|uniref:Bacteriophage protein n=1 Tax=Komagataeibacter medellinensis TaxID=1177712 RepID=A0ABQ6VR75_9PROT|nr:hypothetical protein [Komagataeibacter medellinensis]KAB8122452.1 hypothetical protein D3W54_14775 [Komagataeibacter medellinensis]
MSGPANYQVPFPQGPILINGQMTLEWQRFFLWLWNRTGGALGVDMAFEVEMIDEAQIVSATAQVAAAGAQVTANEALGLAFSAMLRTEIAAAKAQTALSRIEDMLKIELLTSAAQRAEAGRSREEGATEAAIRTAGNISVPMGIWP